MEKIKFTTINEYIEVQPEHKQAALKELRQTIKLAAPEAEEVISYGMPAFKFHGMLAYFAAHTNHYGLYVPKILHLFEAKLSAYNHAKATVQFPYDKPFPAELVAEIIKCAAANNMEKAELKKEMKRKK
jgi:uncharacterized protein YdhG (YjbR/CyaY superfamily)